MRTAPGRLPWPRRDVRLPGGSARGNVSEFASLEWVDWFNNRRPLEPIGCPEIVIT